MDFSAVPLFALSTETKTVISSLLNPTKIFSTDQGYPRDWRGLAQYFKIPGETLPLLSSLPDPSERILQLVRDRDDGKATFKDLQEALRLMERWDVFEDTVSLLEKDARHYQERMGRSQSSAEALDNNVDLEMLTMDDLYRHRAGLERQGYDAFLLYADEDFDFAKEMIDRLEKENLKLCTKDRDLIAGVTFEHEAIMQLISERCNRLIVIISPNFLKSPANKFFLTYAQAVGIDKQQRKLIPCIYKDCKLPMQLSYTNKMNYNRRGMYDFWGRLRDSVQTPSLSKSEANGLASSIGNNSNNAVIAADKIPVKSCDNNLLEDENAPKANTALVEVEKPQEAASEPNLSKCARVSSKPHAALSNWVRKKKKKADEFDLDEINEDQVDDSVPNLPSIPLDDLNLIPSDSGSKKKNKKSVLMKNFFKRIPTIKKS